MGRPTPDHGERVAALSTLGRHLAAEESGHYIQYTRPEMVVDAIREVLAQLDQESG